VSVCECECVCVCVLAPAPGTQERSSQDQAPPGISPRRPPVPSAFLEDAGGSLRLESFPLPLTQAVESAGVTLVNLIIGGLQFEVGLARAPPGPTCTFMKFENVRPVHTRNCRTFMTFGNVRPVHTRNCRTFTKFENVRPAHTRNCRTFTKFENVRAPVTIYGAAPIIRLTRVRLPDNVSFHLPLTMDRGRGTVGEAMLTCADFIVCVGCVCCVCVAPTSKGSPGRTHGRCLTHLAHSSKDTDVEM